MLIKHCDISGGVVRSGEALASKDTAATTATFPVLPGLRVRIAGAAIVCGAPALPALPALPAHVMGACNGRM